jgi:leader peptidase (prepilin peptidase)/N-methyltransferase
VIVSWVLAGVIGLVIGSFLNVVIARLPERRSLWKPGSACPTCGAAIAWHDNIPLVSYALLRGRCRACAGSISTRYPVVEAVTGALFMAAFARFGWGRDLGVAWILLAALVAITVIDLDHQIIPDVITLPGIVTGFIVNVASGRLFWTDSLFGILLGGGVFFAIILASGGGMGGGDMKLGAMFGAFLGWKVTIVAIFLAVIAGGVVAAAMLAAGRKGRKDAIPFGPFLAVGGAAAVFWGERIVTWYRAGF